MFSSKDIEELGIVENQCLKLVNFKNSTDLTVDDEVLENFDCVVTANELGSAIKKISDGKIVEPTILKRNDTNFKLNNKYKNEIKIIKNAMFKVVNENKGTAFSSRIDDIKFAGKTGTSQVRRISLSERESDDFRKKELEWKNRDHALFVAFLTSHVAITTRLDVGFILDEKVLL